MVAILTANRIPACMMITEGPTFNCLLGYMFWSIIDGVYLVVNGFTQFDKIKLNYVYISLIFKLP